MGEYEEITRQIEHQLSNLSVEQGKKFLNAMLDAIDSKHKKVFRIEVSSSHDFGEGSFIVAVSKVLLETEIKLNTDFPLLRFHIWEIEE